MELQSKGCTIESESDQNQNSTTLSHHQNLPVLYKIADNLFNKRNQLFRYITSVNSDITCVTEVLPKNTSIPVDDASSKFQVLITLE